MQGVFTPKDKDDNHNVVSIGKDAYVGGDLDDSRGAVIIGRRVAQNMVSGGSGNVLVGVDLLSSSTQTSSSFNVIIGRNTCRNHTQGITNNVIIGNQACREGSDTSMVNNVIVGSDACRGNFVGSSGVVAIGRRAGYRSASSTATMGDKAIMIGSDTNSGDSEIGSYSIAIGTANGQGITNDSVCIGRQAVCQGSGTGQMVLGNNSYNKTMVLCTSESTKIKTGAGGTLLTSLELTTDNATMQSNAATTLTCGTNSLQVLADKCTFSRPIVLSSPIICDSDGKSLFVGPSIWFSGRSDGLLGSAAEVRRLNIPPSCFVSDDDSSTRSGQAYALESSTEYYPSEFDDTETGYDGFAGIRVQTTSDVFVYMPTPPDGWKVIGCRVEIYDRSTRASKAVLLEVFSRNIDGDNANITMHVSKTDLKYTGTNVNFTTDFTPSASRYLVGYLGNGSASHVYTGGFMSISRV